MIVLLQVCPWTTWRLFVKHFPDHSQTTLSETEASSRFSCSVVGVWKRKGEKRHLKCKSECVTWLSALSDIGHADTGPLHKKHLSHQEQNDNVWNTNYSIMKMAEPPEWHFISALNANMLLSRLEAQPGHWERRKVILSEVISAVYSGFLIYCPALHLR